MQIFVDADGCPVVSQTIALGQKYQVPVTLLCDTSHEFSREGATTITVSKGADSADFALANKISPGDLAITQDYGLAAMCLARQAFVLDQNGRAIDDENLNVLLAFRHFSKKLRASGGRTKGPKKRQPEQNDAFSQALEALLSAQNPSPHAAP